MARNGTKPTLIVFGDLPGTGKSTRAQALALDLGAADMGIDEIEEALRSSSLSNEELGTSRYLTAYALSDSNLRLGAKVPESVDASLVTRNAWRGVAAKTAARLIEVENFCSDKIEHRRQVESRTGDGLQFPSWQVVEKRAYDDQDRAQIVIDTDRCSSEEASIELRRPLPGPGRRH